MVAGFVVLLLGGVGHCFHLRRVAQCPNMTSTLLARRPRAREPSGSLKATMRDETAPSEYEKGLQGLWVILSVAYDGLSMTNAM